MAGRRSSAVSVAALVLSSVALVAHGAAEDPSAAPWPLEQDGLVFLWENGNASNSVPGDGPVEELCRLLPRAQARYDRFWAMQLTGGAFRAEDGMNADLLAAMKAAQAVTIEAVVTPYEATQTGPAHILSFGKSSADWNLALVQDGDQIRFAIRPPASSAPEWIALGTARAGQPHHVLLSVGEDGARAYLDGAPAGSNAQRLEPARWTNGQLVFGQAADGSADWSGTVEGVAIYRRRLDAAAAAAHHAAYAPRLEGRNPLPDLEVSARLVTKRTIPEAEVYPDSLVVFDYRLGAVHAGAYEHDKVLVAHWGNLNGLRRKAVDGLRRGRTYRIRLEPFEDHPELSSAQLVMNEQDLHLPLFYATSDPIRE